MFKKIDPPTRFTFFTLNTECATKGILVHIFFYYPSDNG